MNDGPFLFGSYYYTVTCFFILIALSACSVILTVIVLRVYHKNVDSFPPSWAFMLLRIFIDRKVVKKMR